MDRKFRFYLVTDDGLHRLPQRALAKRMRLPGLAGRPIQMIQARYQLDARGVRLDCHGSYVQFDTEGAFGFPPGYLEKGMELGEIGIVERFIDPPPENVVRIEPVRRQRQLEADLEWQPTDDQIEAIAADLLGRKRGPGAKALPVLRD